MKEENRKYPTTVKWTYEELIHVQVRAKSLGVSRVEYLRLRALEPIEEFHTAREQKDNAQRELIESHAFLKELNRQGINLNQITRAINSGKLEGSSIERCLQCLEDIKSINQGILKSLSNLGAS
jgi:hypothetical protein